jgi:leucyl aminopeptidase
MAGVLGSDPKLVDTLRQAGDVAAEWLWPLPVHEDYLLQMRSDVADLQNSGGRAASAITAGMFLREFTKGLPWAHLDIAGMATIDSDVYQYLKRPYNPKEGATGFGTRLLYHFMKAWNRG